MPRPKTVRYMANEAGLDIDEALLLFWEKDLKHLEGPDDRIPPGQLRSARDALGLPDIRHLRRVDYWCKILNVDRPGLARILDKYNLKLQPNARNLPKNGIAALRKYSRVVVHPSIPSDLLTDSSESIPSPSSATPFKPLEWREIGRVANDINF